MAVADWPRVLFFVAGRALREFGGDGGIPGGVPQDPGRRDAAGS